MRRDIDVSRKRCESTATLTDDRIVRCRELARHEGAHCWWSNTTRLMWTGETRTIYELIKEENEGTLRISLRSLD